MTERKIGLGRSTENRNERLAFRGRDNGVTVTYASARYGNTRERNNCYRQVRSRGGVQRQKVLVQLCNRHQDPPFTAAATQGKSPSFVRRENLQPRKARVTVRESLSGIEPNG